MREKADVLLGARLKANFQAAPNDTPYQWASSGDYNPSQNLEKILAAVLAINAADDKRTPPETGIRERAMKRIKNARRFLIPASADTGGMRGGGRGSGLRGSLVGFN